MLMGHTDAEDLERGVSEKERASGEEQTSFRMTKAPTKTRAMEARNRTVASRRTGLNIFGRVRRGRWSEIRHTSLIWVLNCGDVRWRGWETSGAYPDEEAGAGEGDKDADRVEDWQG